MAEATIVMIKIVIIFFNKITMVDIKTVICLNCDRDKHHTNHIDIVH